ncbi:nuclear transport factor 2 family protein [Nocardia sp. CDC159]|uniref:Nuclear transport factor 2 family protein n=1 Tax=Nocardia pulmonis TaxID=2951408 RepID=A0A9X2E3L8_9NOCA|nr:MULTISPECIES: nuclear transport factor 2 family protein [Nocardia]MCM6772458.1 nuclear transport factor 2 family protein [Nocardia pulmonis]MCM6784884.1 nuclear transport factor 2 family protein [Nocardia sp. CDC159]
MEVVSMTAEENKQVVRRYFELVSGGRVDEAADLLADDAVQVVPGDPTRMPGAGTHPKAELVAALHGLRDAAPDGIAFTPTTFTAEDDRVAVEGESYGKLANGKIYNTPLHHLFQIRDGKIHSVHEYFDTQHAAEAFADPS